MTTSSYYFIPTLPSSPHTFSAKEKDSETGYSYFGARYYDSEVSVWLSVDPLADKYPSMSAYMYTAGNPVMLVDPDGRSYNPYLLFNGKNNTLSIYDDNKTPDDYSDDVFLGSYSAHNNVAKSSNGKWEDGVYEMEDKKSRHKHGKSTEKDGTTLKDSKNGSYGEGGIYRAKSFMETLGKKFRSGMAVHAGRALKSFFKRITMGCIRTTPEAMEAIDKAIQEHGSLTNIIVQENRTSANSSKANVIKPGQGNSSGPLKNNIPAPVNEPDALRVETPITKPIFQEI